MREELEARELARLLLASKPRHKNESATDQILGFQLAGVDTRSSSQVVEGTSRAGSGAWQGVHDHKSSSDTLEY